MHNLGAIRPQPFPSSPWVCWPHVFGLLVVGYYECSYLAAEEGRGGLVPEVVALDPGSLQLSSRLGCWG